MTLSSKNRLRLMCSNLMIVGRRTWGKHEALAWFNQFIWGDPLRHFTAPDLPKKETKDEKGRMGNRQHEHCGLPFLCTR
jgi:hypothetical protein